MTDPVPGESFTQAEMWEACYRRLPHLKKVPRATIGIIRAMEMTARHLFVYGVAGDEATAQNIREQLKYLDIHGQTSWHRTSPP